MAIVVFYSAQDNEFFIVLQALLVALVMGGVAGVSAITTIQLYKQSKYREALAWTIPHVCVLALVHPVFTIEAYSSRLVACSTFWRRLDCSFLTIIQYFKNKSHFHL
jgi:ABC-type proline/glycine betaine transport system permease subunit